MAWDFTVDSEQNGVVNFLEACQHDYGIAQLSKEIHVEMQPTVEAAKGLGCKHIDFTVELPSLDDVPDEDSKGDLLQATQERAG